MNQSTNWYTNGNMAASLGANYDQYLVPTIFGPWAADLVALAAPQPEDQVLDVACGTGTVALHVAQILGATGSITGLDLNPGMLAIARTHDPSGRISWHEGSAQAMPFQDDAFTLIFCQQGLQFFPDRGIALREMYRVLAFDGQLVLSVWRSIEHSPGFLIFGHILAQYLGAEWETLPPFALGDGMGLAKEVAEAGFRMVTTQIASRGLHFASPDEFVRAYISSTPLASIFAQAEEVKRTAILAETSVALQPYLDETGLVFPIESQIILALK
jgi:SAM-dependent methyltransferase